jgi:hypothetical protein
MEQQKNYLHLIKYYAPTILIVIGVIALGLFALNQFMDWIYKVQLLAQPCDLCIKLNPSLRECFLQPVYSSDLFKPINYSINISNAG